MRLEVLATALLVAIAATDLAMRSIDDIRPFVFRPWEAARYHHPQDKAFRPNYKAVFERTWGDLANLASAVELRQYRRQVFSTDAQGFRDAGGTQPIDAIMMGDSQGVGAACSDDETIAVQAGAILGKRIYNACGLKPDNQVLDRLAKLNPRDKLLIFEWVDQPDAMVIPPATGAVEENQLKLAPWQEPFRSQLEWPPLMVAIYVMLHQLRDGKILASPNAGRVAAAPLADGSIMLFNGRDVSAAMLHRRPQVEYFQWLDHAARRRGLTLLVMVLPNKYEANAEVLQKPYVDKYDYPVEQAATLRKVGIRAFSAGPALRAVAKAWMPEHRNPFWLDDTHLRPEGNAVMARLLSLHYARALAPSK